MIIDRQPWQNEKEELGLGRIGNIFDHNYVEDETQHYTEPWLLNFTEAQNIIYGKKRLAYHRAETYKDGEKIQKAENTPVS